MDLEVQKNNIVTYTKDSYSTENESESFYRDYKVPTCGFCINGNFSVNERLSKENISLPANAEVIDIYATALADSFDFSGDRGSVISQVKYTLIICNDDEYSSIDIVLPAKYEFECNSDNISTYDAKLEVFSCRVRKDTDSISIDSEISVCIKGSGKDDIIVLSEIDFKNKIAKNKNEITVCYPSCEDTLWSIAKKYHIPMSRINMLNGTDGIIDGKEYLIV